MQAEQRQICWESYVSQFFGEHQIWAAIDLETGTVVRGEVIFPDGVEAEKKRLLAELSARLAGIAP